MAVFDDLQCACSAMDQKKNRIGVILAVLFCFVFLAALGVPVVARLYHRDGFPTLKFVVVFADLLATC